MSLIDMLFKKPATPNNKNVAPEAGKTDSLSTRLRETIKPDMKIGDVKDLSVNTAADLAAKFVTQEMVSKIALFGLLKASGFSLDLAQANTCVTITVAEASIPKKFLDLVTKERADRRDVVYTNMHSNTGPQRNTYSRLPRFGVFVFEGTLFWHYLRQDTRVIQTLRTSRAAMDKLYELCFDEKLKNTIRISGPNGSPKEITPRPLDTVIVSASTQLEVLDAIEKWYKSKEEYARIGRPWKLVICLYGEPGNGKTSLFRAIAGKYKRDIYRCNTAEFDDGGLYSALHGTEDGIILLEDFIPPSKEGDVITVEEKSAKPKIARDGELVEKEEVKVKHSKLTLGGVLNALDGIDPLDDKIVFITTNHPDKLPPELLRKGRVDVLHHVANQRDPEIRKFFHLYFPGHEIPAGMSFGEISGANIQALFDKSNGDVNYFLNALPKPGELYVDPEAMLAYEYRQKLKEQEESMGGGRRRGGY